jgi:hypothetical protein
MALPIATRFDIVVVNKRQRHGNRRNNTELKREGVSNIGQSKNE